MDILIRFLIGFFIAQIIMERNGVNITSVLLSLFCTWVIFIIIDYSVGRGDT